MIKLVRQGTFRRALWIALIPGAILFMVMQTYAALQVNVIGLDSHAYWLAGRFPESWYTLPPAYRDAFLYSPAFGQALGPLSQLPWTAFQVLWALTQVCVWSGFWHPWDGDVD